MLKPLEADLAALTANGVKLDFREALPTLLGENASGLSMSAITRLVATWFDERSAWKKRSLRAATASLCEQIACTQRAP